MPTASCTEEEFIEIFRRHGARKTAQILGIVERAVFERRRNIESRRGKILNSPNLQEGQMHYKLPEHPGRLHETIKNGTLLLGTDSHYIPGVITDAHKAFVKLAKEIKPDVIVKNGDELDFSAISRFAPIGWEHRPSIVDEIECAGERLDEIRQASKNSRYYWPLGNHDARYETRLATQVPEYAKINGMHLKDHFPGWSPCWSLWVNQDTVIKHRWKGGITAARTHAAFSGKHMFTGHTHRLQLYVFADYNGIRYGMECGTMADPYGPQFQDYTEDNPREWCQAIVLLTFSGGNLLPPEPIICPGDGTYSFRGRVCKL